MSTYENYMLCGLTFEQWFDAFKHTHNKLSDAVWMRIEWPAGGAFADQEHIVVQVYDVIKEELNRMAVTNV